MQRNILTNARIVLPDRTVEGSVVIENERIAEIVADRHYAEGMDMHGLWLAPGIVDIHTDYLEKEINPRPKTNFPLPLAFHMMDQRALACGLTTVLGAVRFSDDGDKQTTLWRGNGLALAEQYEELARTALARHLLHVRWDTNFEPVDELLAQMGRFTCFGNLVYNENIPGQRQFRDMEDLAKKRAARGDLTLEEARERLARQIEVARTINNRPKVLAAFGGILPIGSHDDTTVEHVREAREFGASLAEMPTTLAAAREAKRLGLSVCMGAPNYLRGGSHCGNLGAPEAIAEGLVDILCSDYHFPSLLGAAIKLMSNGTAPHEAFHYVSLAPARHLRRDDDLGSIEAGKLADLIAFEPKETHGVVRAAWVGGAMRLQLSHTVRRASPALEPV
ncbi:alpha-D-ribose 1-methylphosphonate 5-triphosphate diphosphatase [Opitutales bacterium ASA1]|uniref:alpha-D-ribose 1-methylphosphonate 5-triphosphate diphosphatase n=1 Tax=Congregicoccus parvus TaxID=3081749 RepID=UPI002B2F5D30|nr:alpha-D-ribose 1-methylphosphonate 5-triphosphate diphosphatase [Opitutales bacterium ASA1]